MASQEDITHQHVLRKNFNLSLKTLQSLVRTIQSQNRTDASDEEKKQAVICYDEFSATCKAMFGQDVINRNIEAFYWKITNRPDAPVDWTEIFGYFQTDENAIDSQMDVENAIFLLSKRETFQSATGAGKKRRDAIQCIVTIPTVNAVLTVSQKGTITLFNSQMKQYACLHAAESSWFTGCDFLHQLKRVVAVTQRSIVVWNYKCHGKEQDNYVCIRPAEHFLHCVCTVTTQEEDLKDDILVGDDAGFVSLFSIANDDLVVQLSKSEIGSQRVVLDSKKLKQFKRKLHNDCVVKVKFIQELNCFASSSLDSRLSLALDNIQRIKDDRPIKGISVPKGVGAFAFCVKTNTIVTGGPDKIIRLWHPHVLDKPMAKLFGHIYSIVDITVNQRDQHIISLSAARGFRVWDIHTLSLLQVFTDAQVGPGDPRINSMVFDNKHLKLLTGSCVLDVWPLTQMFQDTRQKPCSHDSPINALAYNWVFHQVLSICSESVLKVWEMETGAQVYEIKDAHGLAMEVTAAAIEFSGFHFATAAYNGTLKIWDFGNGYEVKALHPKTRCNDEIQGICQLNYMRTYDNHHIIIALDISGNIKIIQGKDGDPKLFVIMKFNHECGVWFTASQLLQRGQMQRNVIISERDEVQVTSPEKAITCFDILKLEIGFVIATGSMDGDINLYIFEASSVQHIYRRNSDECINAAVNNLQERRINAIVIAFPQELNSFSKSRSHSLINISRPQGRNSFKDNKETSEIYYEKKIDQDTEKTYDPTRYNCSPVSLDGKTPLIVSCHQNGQLCLWNTKGDLISKKLPFTKQPPIPITAICSDPGANVIVAGNQDGYIILWKLCSLQEADEKTNMMLKQELCWRAHSMKINSLFYEDKKNVVVSSSDDGSIRLWHASGGNYIGYYGQRRLYDLNNPPQFILPCDIRELPFHTKTDKTLLWKKKSAFPLLCDKDRQRTKSAKK